MKQTKKYIITMAALLLSVTIWAQGKFTYIYQLNGASSTAAAAGTISGGISENGTATLTLTPAQGNYINADYITVVKTLSGGNAQTRIGTAENVSITASNANADPSETTTYTFAVEDANYDYEVTANFQSRTNISSATVALAATSYTYDGQEHKPAVSSVKLGETTLGTNDYTVSYADDCTNVGSITVTIAGARTYTGTTTATYSITNATMTVTANGYTGAYDGKAHGITVTTSESATIKYGTKKGTYDLDASPTYTDAGTYMVHYQVEKTNYTTIADSAKVEITKATPSITFDKESYSATYGEEFTAPTPSTNPEGLTVTATSSSNTQVATITDGVIKIAGIGETTITVSFAGNNNYEATTATYKLNVAAGSITGITATGYTGTYDGKAHGITVSAPEGATIKYGTKKGTYDLDASPTYTDAGSYMVHYQVERTNYTTIADSAKVEITKATPSITFDKESYSATYGEEFTAPTPSTNPEGLTVTATSSSNTQVATITDGVITIAGVGETTITVSFAGNNNYNAATATYTLNVAAGTTTGITATGYTGTYDGKAHGITVAAPQDAVIKYGTTEGTYNLEASPEYTDAGSYTVYYQVTRANYQTVTGSAAVEIAKATPSITFDKESYSATYGETFTAPTPKTNPEGLTVTATSSSNTQVATVADGVISIIGTGETTITVSFAGNNNYEKATATYTLKVEAGAITGITATGYTGTYDGKAHGINVAAPEGTTIKYGTKKGTYDLDASPTYTDAGSYMVHYQVERTNYTTIADSAKVEITKATPSITFDKESYSATYGETFTAPTPKTNPEGLTVTATSSSNTQVATIADGVISIIGVSETTITVSFAGNNNYNAATATYTLNVAAGTTTEVVATGYTGTYDGKAHGITVAVPKDATIMYGTKKGTYDLDQSPTYTDAGTYWIHYQVERTNYTTIADSAKVEITKATPSITFDKESYSATYGKDFTAPTPSTNPEGLTVSATSSSNTQVATIANGVISIIGVGETTITVSFAGNKNYEAATATYKLNIAAGTITGVSVTGYTDVYDGKAHGIKVEAPKGATIKYGTKKGTYNLDKSPTYTNAGIYMVHYQVEQTNYTTISDSAKVEITKATPSITFDKESYSTTYGDAFTAPTPSTNPEGLTVKAISSSNTQVASVNDGVISIIGIGETTITVSFAGNNNYEKATATYVLTVKKPKAKTYDLWIGGTQVTENNAEDICNQAEDTEQPLYIYNAKNNTLIINKDQRGTAVIESRLPELKVYIMDTCMVKSIYYNDPDNTGTLTFTCNGNYPGKLIIANDEGVSAIKGFSDVSYEYNLSPIEPQYTVYVDGQMKKEIRNSEDQIIETVVADSITIGIYIAPLTNGETKTVNKDDFEDADLTNCSDGELLITVQPDNENPEDGDGIDIDENGETGIFIATTMTDDAAGNVANNVDNNELTPGGGQYAEDYDGITFMVPAGEGVIVIDQIVDPGYEFHLKIGTGAPVTLSTSDEGRVEAEVKYEVTEPTYCYLYMVEVPISTRASARAGNDTRLGKRPRAHGTIYSVKVSPSKVNAANTPSQASGGVIPPSQEQGDIMEFEGIQGVKVVQTTDDRWFTIDGRQIDKPTQKGLYIHNRKKVVVK